MAGTTEAGVAGTAQQTAADPFIVDGVPLGSRLIMGTGGAPPQGRGGAAGGAPGPEVGTRGQPRD